MWRVMVVVALLAAMYPMVAELGAKYEGTVWPIASRITILTESVVKDGIDIRFVYSKLRSCEYKGAYARRNGNDLGFSPLEPDTLATVRAGDRVYRYWHLDMDSLDGVEIFFAYQCAMPWITTTKVYG